MRPRTFVHVSLFAWPAGTLYRCMGDGTAEPPKEFGAPTAPMNFTGNKKMPSGLIVAVVYCWVMA